MTSFKAWNISDCGCYSLQMFPYSALSLWQASDETTMYSGVAWWHTPWRVWFLCNLLRYIAAHIRQQGMCAITDILENELGGMCATFQMAKADCLISCLECVQHSEWLKLIGWSAAWNVCDVLNGQSCSVNQQPRTLHTTALLTHTFSFYTAFLIQLFSSLHPFPYPHPIPKLQSYPDLLFQAHFSYSHTHSFFSTHSHSVFKLLIPYC